MYFLFSNNEYYVNFLIKRGFLETFNNIIYNALLIIIMGDKMKKNNKSAKTNYSCNSNNNNNASKNSTQKTSKSLETNSNAQARNSYDFE